ncbi:hypothetical protein J4426_02685 [Candidatus Woesearchaeota archaeon]|nr:hypothetical protein [Candidatus Woesearchaeota archaeon]
MAEEGTMNEQNSVEESAGNIELGGKITLSGFSSVEPGKMVVVKKIIGNYVKKMEDRTENFESVIVHLKVVHNSEFEIQAKLAANGQSYNAGVTDFNLFFAISRAMDKIIGEI